MIIFCIFATMNCCKTAPKSQHNMKNTASQNKQSYLSTVKEEYLRWVCVLFATIASYVMLAWVVTKIYTPDIELLKKQTFELTFHASNPEPVESMLFNLGLLFIPCCLLLFYWISKKKFFVSIFSRKELFAPVTIVASIVVVAFLWYGFAADNPFHLKPENERDYVTTTNFEFYFKGLFLHNYSMLYLLILFPILVALFFLFFDKLKWDESTKIQKVIAIITWGLLALLLLFIIIPVNSFEFPYTWANKIDFNAIFYSQAQVHGGGAMLLDGLNNNYGLYPQFLHPLFKVIGLNVRTFTTLMALLLAMCFVFQASFLNKFVRNKLLFFFGCAAIFFLPYFNAKLLVTFTAGFNTWPVRYMTFSTLLFVSAFYINNKNNKLYYIIPVLLSMLVLWNPETGIVSLLGWIALLLYMHFYTPTESGLKFSGLKLLKHIAIPLATLVGVFLLYGLLVMWSYGRFPDFKIMFNVMAGFGVLGVGGLPMSPIHPWNFVALLYILGLLYSITKLLNKTITPKSCAIFLLSIIGSGLFMYYRGRSHNGSVFSMAPTAFILLAILCNDLWEITKKYKLFPLRVLFVIAFFFLAFSGVEMLADLPKIKALVNDEQDRLNQLEIEKTVKANQVFIKEHTVPEEKVLLFVGQTEGLYFCAAQIRSAAYPSFTEMMYYDQRTSYEHIVRDSSFKAFIEPAECFSQFNAFSFRNIYAALAATYQVSTSNGSMFLLGKRPMKLDYNPVLMSNSPQQVFYEFFPDDATGADKRVDYSFGKDPVELGNHFSVEVIFDPAPQVVQYATLVGNLSETGGFSIMHAEADTYVFTFGALSYQYPFTVEAGKTNYIKAIVKDNTLEIAVNGTVTGRFLLQNNYTESPAGLCIGTQPYRGYTYQNIIVPPYMWYYFGAIREVAIQRL